MLLPCSGVEEGRDSEQRDRARHLGGELLPQLALFMGSWGNYRELNFPKTQFEAFPEQGHSAGPWAVSTHSLVLL